jgi:hypothetical protein
VNALSKKQHQVSTYLMTAGIVMVIVLFWCITFASRTSPEPFVMRSDIVVFRRLHFYSISRWLDIPIAGLLSVICVGIIHSLKKEIKYFFFSNGHIPASLCLGVVVGLVSQKVLSVHDTVEAMRNVFLFGVVAAAGITGLVGALYGLLFAIVGALFLGPVMTVLGGIIFGLYAGLGALFVEVLFMCFRQGFLVGSFFLVFLMGIFFAIVSDSVESKSLHRFGTFQFPKKR